MLAFNNGQTINFSQLGSSLGVSHGTIRNYVELLQGTFMVQLVPPFTSNIGKRLVKSPKVYLNDAGIINALLGINNINQLLGNPVYGSLWESIVLSFIKDRFPNSDISFYRTSHGAELDFVITYGNNHLGIECKASVSPALEKGTYIAIDDIKPVHTIVVCPAEKGWQMKKNITVSSLSEIYLLIKKYLG
jgi:predicted AAA+ superfamily ATPase